MTLWVFGERESQRQSFSLDVNAAFTYSAEDSSDTIDKLNGTRDSRDSEVKYKSIFLIDVAIVVA